MPFIIQKLLAQHCSAVLLGKKPSALFTARLTATQTRQLNILVQQAGLQLLKLHAAKNRNLLFVYNPFLLAATLKQTLAHKTLFKLGYPANGSLFAMLQHLQLRIQTCCTFPHEVGFFLGYPPADVVGFMLYGGKRCKFSGLWKVYSNVEKAKQLHSEYEHCRNLCCAHLEKGGNLYNLPLLVNQAG